MANGGKCAVASPNAWLARSAGKLLFAPVEQEFEFSSQSSLFDSESKADGRLPGHHPPLDRPPRFRG
jgi:hypothetical protein